MKKKIIYVLIGAIIFLFALLLITRHENNATKNNSLKTIKVSEVTHSIFYAPFYVAIENGYFKDEGIEIDLMLVSGSDNVAASVLSKDTDVGLAGPESAVYVYLGKEKDYLQVFSGLTKRDGQFIISRDNKFDWEDLKNKEILIGRSTGMPALSFLRALENQGIDKEDIKINTSIEFAELSGAFIGGNGDYVNLFEPLASKLEFNKNGYVVQSVGQSSDEFPYTAFYARKNYIEENKDTLTKFTNAIKKGMHYTLSNKGETTAILLKKQFNDTTVEDLAIMIDRYKAADVWLNNPIVEKEFYNTLIDLLKENKLIKETVEYKNLVNNLYE